MNKLKHLGQIITEKATSFLLVFITLLIFVNVILRYIFNNPITFSFDLSTLLFAWLIFLGVPIVHAKSEHMGFNLLDSVLPKPLTTLLFCLREVLIFVLSVFLVYIGYQMIQRVGTNIPSMGISSKYLYAALPVGFFLNIFVCVKNFVVRISRGGS